MASPLTVLLAWAVACSLAASAAEAQSPHERSFALGRTRIAIEGDGATIRARVVRPGRRSVDVPVTGGLLRLHAGTFDPRQGGPLLPARLGAPGAGRLFAVQFTTAVLPEHRALLTSRGLRPVGHWPDSALLVHGPRAAIAALAGEPCVRWAGEVPLGCKLPLQLQAVVAAPESVEPAAIECDLMLADKAMRDEVAAAVTALGGEVTRYNAGATHLRARLSPVQLATAAALDTVVWLQPASAVEYDLNNARIQGGANTVEFAGGITGAGVRVHVLEGVEQTHPDWTAAPLVQWNADGEAHGHCTAMIIGGNGNGNTNARGIAPGSQIVEGAVAAWDVYSRFQVTAEALDPALPWRVMQQTASWGYATTTQYDAASAELDDLLFHLDIPTTQSQSNSGTTSSRPQAWAKNVISVGGVFHRDNTSKSDDAWNIGTTTPASIGPAADGRIKPDIVGYYEAIQCGDLSGSAGYSATNYTTSFSGTSGATPMVAGFVALLQQMFTDGAFGNALPLPAIVQNRFANRPHMTTVKALLCNTASSYAFSGHGHDLTRTHQGWGFPDMARAWNNRQSLVAVDEYDVLQQGQSRTYWAFVRVGAPELRVTMAYADPAALPSAAIHRVNSLDLRVERTLDGVSWWGNNGLDVGNASTPGGAANDRDTLEQVWLPSPSSGLYKVTVSAPVLVQDAHLETAEVDADFALCMHPMGGGYCTPGGFTLDLVSTAPGDLRVSLSGVPQTGWVQGFTLVSFDTRRARGYGNYFGVEGDWVTAAAIGSPLVLGDLFHFPNAGTQYFPFVEHVVPAPLAQVLQGITLDAVTVLVLPDGRLLDVSNVDRLTVQ